MTHGLTKRLALLAFISVGCGQRSTPMPAPPTTAENSRAASTDTESVLNEQISFPTVGLKIRQPAGFEKSKTFDGFEQPSTNSSVMAIRMPGPFSEISAGFTAERLGEAGMKLLSKESQEIDGKPAMLVHFQQSALGDKFEKWSLIFGDEKETLFITGTFPQAEANKLSASIKAAVLSTRLDDQINPQNTSVVPFTLDDKGKLKFATEMARMRLYSVNGKFPVKELSEAIFVAGTSLGSFSKADQKSAVKKQLQSLQQIKNYNISSQNPIEIDDLQGLESIVDGDDSATGNPMRLYHVMLFGDDFYYVLIGMVSRDRFDEFLSEFKSLTASLKKNER